MGAEANGGSRGAASRAECPAVLAGHVGLVPTFAESLSGRAEGCGSRSGHGQSVPWPWRWVSLSPATHLSGELQGPAET